MFYIRCFIFLIFRCNRLTWVEKYVFSSMWKIRFCQMFFIISKILKPFTVSSSNEPSLPWEKVKRDALSSGEEIDIVRCGYFRCFSSWGSPSQGISSTSSSRSYVLDSQLASSIFSFLFGSSLYLVSICSSPRDTRVPGKQYRISLIHRNPSVFFSNVFLEMVFGE